MRIIQFLIRHTLLHSFVARTLIRQPGGENYAMMYVRQEIVQFPYRFKSNHNVLFSKRNKKTNFISPSPIEAHNVPLTAS